MASLGNGRAEIGNLLVQPWDLASSATRASFSIYLGGEFTACQTGDAWAAYCGLARDWNGQMSVDSSFTKKKLVSLTVYFTKKNNRWVTVSY